MSLTILDWAILVASFAGPLIIGLYYYRRAGASVGQFFLCGRDLPW